MWYQSHGALDLGFKVLWSKNEGTDKVLEGTAQEYESTAGANLSTAEVLNAHIRYHLKELRYCAQCLIIENEDFVKRSRNYNMHNMGKTIGELHAMLIEYEKGLPKKAETPQVMMIKGAKDTQLRIDTSITARRWASWKRNCPVYLDELLNKKSKLALPVLQGFREARKLKQGALYLYVGNGVRAQVEAIGSYDLVLPNGLVICKMTMKSFLHRPERATDLLGIMHTDVCGPI
ncbi:hypothetical protein Tco_0625330 [Tanacetum coccineum]|uniref:Uncharacterized protein n=1 Tax=Tanacetum coccineum TaxID=301880 RepID=A0ABQ4WGK2_9ASTR